MLIGIPTPGHRSEAKARDPNPTTTKLARLHVLTLAKILRKEEEALKR
jgi:hypothetical protein